MWLGVFAACRLLVELVGRSQEGTEESLRQSRQRLQRWGAQEGNVVACCSRVALANGPRSLWQ